MKRPIEGPAIETSGPRRPDPTPRAAQDAAEALAVASGLQARARTGRLSGAQRFRRWA